MEGKGGGKREYAQASGNNYTKLDDLIGAAGNFASEKLNVKTVSILTLPEIYFLRETITQKFAAQTGSVRLTTQIVLYGNALSYYASDDTLKGGTLDSVYGRATTLQWINFADTTLWPAINNVASISNTNVKVDSSEPLSILLKYLDKVLEGNTFFVNERISLADIAVFTILLTLYRLDPQLKRTSQFANFNRWFFTILNHPLIRNVIT